MAEVDGTVFYGEISKGSRKILVRTDDGEEREYSILKGLHVNVQEAESVRAGDAFTDGPKDPTRSWRSWGSASCRSTCWTASRRYRPRASTSTTSTSRRSFGR